MNNEKAFPHEAHIQLNTGMTLRDYFAARALQAQHTAFSARDISHGWSDEDMAQDAYEKADAMMKAREQT